VTIGWTSKDTTVHQDHVIAHVMGTTILGYFIHDEALYILLDIGFVWSILLDGEMGLLPHPVAVSELEIGDDVRAQIKTEIDVLLGTHSSSGNLLQFQSLPAACQIEEVKFFCAGEKRRFLITGEEQSLAIETSLEIGEVKVMATDGSEKTDAQGNASEDQLDDVARTEQEYLVKRLREELGREPTEAELDEWLRQHTEGY
jgi:hypothetical protein